MRVWSAFYTGPKGTILKPGCPLSPIIFAIAIETLAPAIRNNPDIRGVRCGQGSDKCALFADDLLPFLTSPLTWTSIVLKLIKVFGRISGMHINMDKSIALNINIPNPLVEQLTRHFPFAWSDTSIPYLGSTWQPEWISFIKSIILLCIRSWGTNLTSWSHGDISWLDRVNSVKMTLLPRLLYFFRSLPIPLQKPHIEKFQSQVVHFIWGSKGYRGPKSVLFRSRHQGGLGVRILWKYYQAAQLAETRLGGDAETGDP